MTTPPPQEEVWLLAGNRLGELTQQRALAAALGRPVREIAVARMAPTGKQVAFDFSALQPPWPRLAISFGKTLTAALHLRAQGATGTLLVHLGLPRKLAVDQLDLVVPMPTDRYVQAPNVMHIGMPFNPAPALPPADSPALRRLLASGWPRPWTALIVGGPTTRGELAPGHVADLARAASERALARGGSLLVSTSPRTPSAVAAVLRAAVKAPGELHFFEPGASGGNPYAAYLHLADELVVTGDSASMIAECWRSGRPLWVSPLRPTLQQRALRRLRALVPRTLIASGRVSADVDVNRWVRRLAREGVVGLWGASDPTRPYVAAEDDELQRAAARIEALLASVSRPA